MKPRSFYSTIALFLLISTPLYSFSPRSPAGSSSRSPSLLVCKSSAKKPATAEGFSKLTVDFAGKKITAYAPTLLEPMTVSWGTNAADVIPITLSRSAENLLRSGKWKSFKFEWNDNACFNGVFMFVRGYGDLIAFTTLDDYCGQGGIQNSTLRCNDPWQE
jgi:hypothetical protein